METYLHITQAILSDWLQQILDDPFYAGALAIGVFMLTAMLYSIRVASLKKINVATEKALIEMQNNLNSAQQKMQLMQEELTANTAQMQKDQHLAQKEAARAEQLEEQLMQRNQQVAGIIQSLHTSFDLGERPVPLLGDIKAEGLWQQHDRVITLLTTRLRSEQQAKIELQQSCQAETVKRAEKEALLETLQTTLATQTGKLFKLEQTLEEQKSILQEQQDKAQRILSQTLEKHLAELARLPELEQQALELVNTQQHLTQLEEKLNAKDALISQLEKDKSVEQIKVQAQPAPLKQEKTKTIIELAKTEAEIPSAPSDIEQQSLSPIKEQAGGIAGKLKGLFGKSKQEPITAEPAAVETGQYEEEIQPARVDVKEQPVTPVKEQTGGVTGKLKSLFGKVKQGPIAAEPEHLETGRYEEETQPAPMDEEQPLVSTTKVQFRKIKNLFGKIK
jgi:hypothetical protein